MIFQGPLFGTLLSFLVMIHIAAAIYNPFLNRKSAGYIHNFLCLCLFRFLFFHLSPALRHTHFKALS